MVGRTHYGQLGDNETMKDRFRRVTYLLHTFTQVPAAINFIHQQEANQMSVFLIVLGQCARQNVREIFDLLCSH